MKSPLSLVEKYFRIYKRETKKKKIIKKKYGKK